MDDSNTLQTFNILGSSQPPRASAHAPAPSKHAAAANVDDLISGCKIGEIFCQKIQVSDNQIITTMWISAAVGAIFFVLFCLLRGKIKIYTTRLHLGTVWILPPVINTKGFHKYWSWMWVLIRTSDAQLAQSCGLDALIWSRILSMGVQIFLAATVLAMIMVLPVVRTGGRIEEDHVKNTALAVSSFSKLTASNLPRGSALYWVLMVYMFLITAITCFILATYYKANVMLRQRYMSGGESEMNEWNNQTLAENEQAAEKSMGQVLADAVNNILNPAAQMYIGDEDLNDATSMFSGGRREASVHRKRSKSTRRKSETGSKKDTRSLTISPDSINTSFRSPRPQADAERCLRPMSTHTFGPTEGRKLSAVGEEMVPEQTSAPGHRRGASQLRREILDEMGLTPRHEVEQLRGSSKSKLLHPMFVTSTKRASKTDLQALQSIQIDTKNQLDGIYGSRISKYERDAPLNEPDVNIHPKWWHASERSKNTPQDESGKAGKPNVSYRKVIYSQNEDGTPNLQHMVNAQNYAVLVTDVPDIQKAKTRRVRREQRSGALWAAWYRFSGLVQHNLLMRKDKDRKTGDLIIPASTFMHGTPMTARTRRNSNVQDEEGNQSQSPRHLLQPDSAMARTTAWLAQRSSEDGTNAQALRHEQDNEGEVNQASLVPELSLRIESFDQHKSAMTDIVSPKSQTNVRSLDDDASCYSERAGISDEVVDGEDLVRRTFSTLFPDSFEGVIPVRNHKSVDLLIEQCSQACVKLQEAEYKYEKSGKEKRPMGYPLRGTLFNPINWCRSGPQEDLIDYYAKLIRDLEIKIVEERREVSAKRPKTSFFVLFTSQQDAAMAAQSKIHPESGHSFKTQAAPGPEEVNWQSLWVNWLWREVRGITSLFLVAMILLFPIGLASGVLNQLTIAICSNSSSTNKFYSANYCARSSLSRSLVTGVLPPVILILYQMTLMPTMVYRIAQFQRDSYSMSELDRKIGVLFFLYDIFNVFLGAMLGGSIFGQIGTLWKNPSLIPKSIGVALPAASNFFINYIIIQAFVSQFVRMVIPHLGVFPAYWRALGLGSAKTEIQIFNALSVHSIRYGREIGSLMLIYLVGLCYASTSPIILPFSLFYCVAAWVFWRYNILYVSERCYESGGRIWELTFRCMIWILFIAELFTGAVMLANGAYPQAAIMWVVMTPLLYKFARFCDTRYANAIRHMPLESTALQPRASVPAYLYLPPAMREGCAGWHPETGKAWENFGMPRYGCEWPKRKPKNS